MSPYQGALAHIERHPGTGSAGRLAKLLLSLWNGEDCGFSFRECIEGLDDERLHIALGCVLWFADHGEDAELVRVGYRVHELYPRTWELGIAARDAKAALRAKWDEPVTCPACSGEPYGDEDEDEDGARSCCGYCDGAGNVPSIVAQDYRPAAPEECL